MRYYCLDADGLPVCTNNTAIAEEWIKQNAVVFDTETALGYNCTGIEGVPVAIEEVQA